jgi:hypothetical protein
MPVHRNNRSLLEKYIKEILITVLAAFLGLLNIVYEQPIILSMFSFLIIALVVMVFKFKIDQGTLAFGFILSYLIAVVSQNIPDKIQFIMLFTPLTVSLYLFLSNYTPLMFTNSLTRLIKRPITSRNRKITFNYLKNFFHAPFLIISSVIYFLITYFIFSLIVAFPFSQIIFRDVNIFYSFVLQVITGLFYQIWLYLFPLMMILPFGVLTYFKKRTLWNRLARFKMIKLYVIILLIFIISFFISLVVYVPFLSLYSINIDLNMESNFKICQSDNITYVLSTNNPFSSICYENVFYKDMKNQTLKYFILLPENRTISYFELPQTNNTVQYIVTCNKFESLIRNVDSC